MNNIFNIKRFGFVLSKDFQEKWKRYILQFLTMFGIMAVALTWFFYTNHREVYAERDYINLWITACVLFLGFGVFFASTMMEPVREKTRRISFLTLPASNVEKFLSRWLIVTFGYIIAFFIALWLADAVRVAICSHYLPEHDIRFLDFGKLVNPEKENNYQNYVFFSTCFFGFWISVYTLLQSLFVLGATFWEKASFIKTFSAITVIVLLFLFLNWEMIKIIYQDMDAFAVSFNTFLTIIFPEEITDKDVLRAGISLFTFFTPFCWVIAFFRFRESEIIKRL